MNIEISTTGLHQLNSSANSLKPTNAFVFTVNKYFSTNNGYLHLVLAAYFKYLLWPARRKVEKKTFIVHGTQRWNLISVRR
jgi:hypothetical protein